MEKQRRTEYKLPDDALRRMVDWMTAAEAAQAWGCHRTTARRYMRQRRDQTHSRLIVLVRGNNRRRVLVCPRGTPPPRVSLCGNPDWHDSARQRRLANRRWHRHTQLWDLWPPPESAAEKEANPVTTLETFCFPADRLAFCARYMRIPEAAHSWGVSDSTARRWVQRQWLELGCVEVWIVTPNAQQRVTVVPIGARPSRPRKGNPNMHSKAWQAAQAAKRWEATHGV